jgi:hypothetical protein
VPRLQAGKDHMSVQETETSTTINLSDKMIETLLMALDTALYFEREYPEFGEAELEVQRQKIADMEEAQRMLTELQTVRS